MSVADGVPLRRTGRHRAGHLGLRAETCTVRIVPIGFGVQAELGPFRVEGCPTSHDAAEPLAVVVRTADGISVGVAYDLGRPTGGVRYLLRCLTALVLESNYDEILLRTSGYPPVVQNRIAGSSGHLSNRAAAELLASLHHPELAAVVLAHLSERCNSAADALSVIGPALRASGISRCPARGDAGHAVAADCAAVPAGPAQAGALAVGRS